MDYHDMPIWQLEQERAKIDAELAKRRTVLGRDGIGIQWPPSGVGIQAICRMRGGGGLANATWCWCVGECALAATPGTKLLP